MTEEKFCNPDQMDVFTFGRPPVCIEILTRISGLEFQFAFNNSAMTVWEGIAIRIIDSYKAFFALHILFTNSSFILLRLFTYSVLNLKNRIEFAQTI